MQAPQVAAMASAFSRSGENKPRPALTRRHGRVCKVGEDHAKVFLLHPQDRMRAEGWSALSCCLSWHVCRPSLLGPAVWACVTPSGALGLRLAGSESPGHISVLTGLRLPCRVSEGPGPCSVRGLQDGPHRALCGAGVAWRGWAQGRPEAHAPLVLVWKSWPGSC